MKKLAVKCSLCGAEKILMYPHQIQSWNRSKLKRCVKCRSIKHGNCVGEYSKTYMVWSSMLQRTTNKNNKQYSDYGGRGIGVSDSWLDFKNFLHDMGDKPDGLTLERLDNEKGYCKTNCIWATYSQQANNRRPRKLSDDDILEIRKLLGVIKQKDIALKFNVSCSTISEIKNGRTHNGK